MWYNRRKEGNMKIGIVGSGSIVNEALPLLSECGWEPAAMCGTKRSFEKVQYTAHTQRAPQKPQESGTF